MNAKDKTSPSTLRRRDLGAVLFGAAALLVPTSGAPQNVLERLKDEIKGGIQALKDDVREEVAYFLGFESYVYGYPLVIMDVFWLLVPSPIIGAMQGGALPSMAEEVTCSQLGL